MNTYFNNLNERERLAVIIGAAALFFFLFYWLVYSPLTDSKHNKILQIKDKQATLDWMKKVYAQQATFKKSQSVSSGQLLTLIANQLHGVAFNGVVYQIQQMGSGDIQLSYEQVPFNAFISWLWELNQKYTINIKQFSAEHTTTAGLAKILVILSAEETTSR